MLISLIPIICIFFPACNGGRYDYVADGLGDSGYIESPNHPSDYPR